MHVFTDVYKQEVFAIKRKPTSKINSLAEETLRKPARQNLGSNYSVESNKRKMRKTGRGCSIILLGVVLICAAIPVFVMGLIMNSQAEEKNKTNICVSEKCIISASRIISSMDSSVDPCDDFYQFACGGDSNTYTISERGSASGTDELEELVEHRVRKIFDEGISPSMPESVKQAIDYYEKCIDEDTQNENGTLSMFMLLESMGLPRVKTRYSIQKPWPEVLIQGDKITGKTPFFSIEIEQKNGTSYLTWNVQKQVFNKQLFEEFIKLINNHFHGEKIDLKKGAKQLFNFYSSLVKIATDKHDNHVWLHVDQLQKLTDGKETLKNTRFDWRKFLTSYLEDSFFNFDLEKDKILVRSPSRAKKLFRRLRLSRKKTEKIDLYTWFFYYYAMAPYTKTVFRDKYFEMDPVFRLNGPMPTDLKTRCTKLARGFFPDAINYEYLSRYFDEERKQKMEMMVDDIHQAFIQLIKGLDWTDEQTKRFALDKLDAVKPNIGYPQWLFVPAVLDARNYFLEDVKGDWLTMNLKANIAATKKYNDTKWTGISKSAVNAFYEGRQVYVPAGILQPPFTGNELASLNYASLGAIIGHEFTHCFDNIGYTIDKNGEPKNWWSRETLKNFYQRVQCMIDQYSEFHIPEFGPNVKLNGAQTINENIADNGGLREALLAYDLLKNRQTHNDSGTEVVPDPEPYLPGLTDYSHKQLFFLGYANMWCQNEPDPFSLSLRLKDTHSPSRQRVLGTLANTKEFAEAWKCPVGSKMNPINK